MIGWTHFRIYEEKTTALKGLEYFRDSHYIVFEWSSRNDRSVDCGNIFFNMTRKGKKIRLFYQIDLLKNEYLED